MNRECDIIIGLEVHVQLNTNTKLFCGCSTEFGKKPNSQTCPVCLGHPGVLPVMNRKAFELSLKAALAFGSDITPFTKFDRKHYYYPDLPKNYQISQYDLPFSTGGKVEFLLNGRKRAIQLIRIHLEEDAGKLIHDNTRNISHVDLNRTGTPLLEIVSEPDISSSLEAHEYLNALKLVLKYLEVSDCNMQEGSLRCDANINIKVGNDYTPISEVKNLNSFKGVENALSYEAERQYREYKKTGKTKHDTPKVTVGWDAEKGVTLMQRSKEEAHDYRYFPEPDVPPIYVTEEIIDKIRKSIGELPLDRKERFMDEMGLNDYDASVLIQDKYVADYFEKCVSHAGKRKVKVCANFVTNDVLRELGERQVSIQEFPVSPEEIADLIGCIEKGEVNLKIVRDTVFPAMISEKKSAKDVIQEKKLKQLSDENKLNGIIKKVLEDNPKPVSDYMQGKKKALGFLMGQVMKATKGQANYKMVDELLQKHLSGMG